METDKLLFALTLALESTSYGWGNTGILWYCSQLMSDTYIMMLAHVPITYLFNYSVSQPMENKFGKNGTSAGVSPPVPLLQIGGEFFFPTTIWWNGMYYDYPWEKCCSQRHDDHRDAKK